MTDLHDVVSPDDSGSDTFARFCYQAHATFPYCLRLVQGQGVTDVFAEHVEDIAVHDAGSWRFLQVKSGDPGRGPWTFAEALKSGAFRSLWRAYRTAGPVLEATYEVCLEGAVRNDDVLFRVVEEGELDDGSLDRLANDLGVTTDDIQDFTARLRVRSLSPLRSASAARCSSSTTRRTRPSGRSCRAAPAVRSSSPRATAGCRSFSEFRRWPVSTCRASA
jgi:hypothetical protein